MTQGILYGVVFLNTKISSLYHPHYRSVIEPYGIKFFK